MEVKKEPDKIIVLLGTIKDSQPLNPLALENRFSPMKFETLTQTSKTSKV